MLLHKGLFCLRHAASSTSRLPAWVRCRDRQQYFERNPSGARTVVAGSVGSALEIKASPATALEWRKAELTDQRNEFQENLVQPVQTDLKPIPPRLQICAL